MPEIPVLITHVQITLLNATDATVIDVSRALSTESMSRITPVCNLLWLQVLCKRCLVIYWQQFTCILWQQLQANSYINYLQLQDTPTLLRLLPPLLLPFHSYSTVCQVHKGPLGTAAALDIRSPANIIKAHDIRSSLNTFTQLTLIRNAMNLSVNRQLDEYPVTHLPQ